MTPDIVDIKKAIRDGEIKVCVNEHKMIGEQNEVIPYKQILLENVCGEKIMIYDELEKYFKK